MKALIINSGTGSRMGDLTKDHPKAMTTLPTGETILSRQIRQLEQQGITDICLTTGYYHQKLVDHATSVAGEATFTIVNNPLYDSTNYIYSVYLAAHALEDDLIFMHGDLVFDDDVLGDLLKLRHSAAVISSTTPLPDKDFKAVLDQGFITAIGVEFFTDAVAMQPLYQLQREDWLIWLESITEFIKAGQDTCYAEAAFNAVSHRCRIHPHDVKDRLCAEIDTPDDLAHWGAILERSNT